MKYMIIFAGMKRNNCYLYILSLMSAMLATAQLYAQQGWTLDWEGRAYLNGGTGDCLPFWQRTGYDGIMPNTSSAVFTAGADFKYKASNGLYFETGANLVGQAFTASPWNERGAAGFVDRLYVSGGWKMLHLDVGMKPRVREFGDLSISSRTRH